MRAMGGDGRPPTPTPAMEEGDAAVAAFGAAADGRAAAADVGGGAGDGGGEGAAVERRFVIEFENEKVGSTERAYAPARGRAPATGAGRRRVRGG